MGLTNCRKLGTEKEGSCGRGNDGREREGKADRVMRETMDKKEKGKTEGDDGGEGAAEFSRRFGMEGEMLNPAEGGEVEIACGEGCMANEWLDIAIEYQGRTKKAARSDYLSNWDDWTTIGTLWQSAVEVSDDMSDCATTDKNKKKKSYEKSERVDVRRPLRHSSATLRSRGCRQY